MKVTTATVSFGGGLLGSGQMDIVVEHRSQLTAWLAGQEALRFWHANGSSWLGGREGQPQPVTIGKGIGPLSVIWKSAEETVYGD